MKTYNTILKDLQELILVNRKIDSILKEKPLDEELEKVFGEQNSVVDELILCYTELENFKTNFEPVQEKIKKLQLKLEKEDE
jgi:hypothetical protein